MKNTEMRPDVARLNRFGAYFTFAPLSFPVLIVLGIKSIDCYVGAAIQEIYTRLLIALIVIFGVAVLIRFHRNHYTIEYPNGSRKISLTLSLAYATLIGGIFGIVAFVAVVFAAEISIILTSVNEVRFETTIESIYRTRGCMNLMFENAPIGRNISVCADRAPLLVHPRVGDMIIVSELIGPIGARFVSAKAVATQQDRTNDLNATPALPAASATHAS